LWWHTSLVGWYCALKYGTRPAQNVNPSQERRCVVQYTQHEHQYETFTTQNQLPGIPGSGKK
jgi:hypothetical protein